MKNMRFYTLMLAASFSTLAAVTHTQTAWAESVQGTISFLAQTNVPGFKFSGESHEFSSVIERKGMNLASLEIKIPVESLKTGMGIRDKHMYERVFVASDGSMPPVVFKSSKSVCSAASGGTQECELPGTLSFRGQSLPYALKATVSPVANGLKVKARTLVDVLSFGVAPEKLKWTKIAVDKDAVVELDVEIK